MNLKLNAIILLIGLVSGSLLTYKLVTKEPVVITKTVTNVKTKVVKVTEPSGRITETTEQVLSEKKNEKVDAKNYAIALGLDNAGARARLGNLPLFLEAGYNWSRNNFEARLSYEF